MEAIVRKTVIDGETIYQVVKDGSVEYSTSDLSCAETMRDFLQGKMPKGITMKNEMILRALVEYEENNYASLNSDEQTAIDEAIADYKAKVKE